ncbi:hypothetical protein FB45DRAFT_918924 [Roridomyces roridus]|uniref:Uncharacterized protein n=1 Tax=Roridomyces roridus TaxID=1738132 RepID=A0AAD7FK27_9AGAR|nr:hypothetical protein FB45DRAFT_918924 [Roridomyces roridus]
MTIHSRSYIPTAVRNRLRSVPVLCRSVLHPSRLPFQVVNLHTGNKHSIKCRFLHPNIILVSLLARQLNLELNRRLQILHLALSPRNGRQEIAQLLEIFDPGQSPRVDGPDAQIRHRMLDFNQLQSRFKNESRISGTFLGRYIEYFFCVLDGLLQCGDLASGSGAGHQVANKGQNCDGQCGVAQDVVGDEGDDCSGHEGKEGFHWYVRSTLWRIFL